MQCLDHRRRLIGDKAIVPRRPDADTHLSRADTPLVSKVEALYKQHGLSTVMVIDYLSVAYTIFGMEIYLPHDWTGTKRDIVQKHSSSLELHGLYGTIPEQVFYHPGQHLAKELQNLRGMGCL